MYTGTGCEYKILTLPTINRYKSTRIRVRPAPFTAQVGELTEDRELIFSLFLRFLCPFQPKSSRPTNLGKQKSYETHRLHCQNSPVTALFTSARTTTNGKKTDNQTNKSITLTAMTWTGWTSD
ncbi:hypothetical protein M9H77_02235 [Catharanthus roseus]|uniref:Uncharacterized protein n=1 Tax=Catharanthus roseus TaxID=4058 RepID=A0ACC0C7R6_CATRO|nr:hypothetical protein M9H77_02235 [Catharanthus roseus]